MKSSLASIILELCRANSRLRELLAEVLARLSNPTARGEAEKIRHGLINVSRETLQQITLVVLTPLGSYIVASNLLKEFKRELRRKSIAAATTVIITG